MEEGPAGTLPTLARNIHMQAATPFQGFVWGSPEVKGHGRTSSPSLSSPDGTRSLSMVPLSWRILYPLSHQGAYNTSVHLVANLKSFVLLHVMFFVSFFNMETLIIVVSGPDLQRDWGAVRKQC